MHDLAGSMIIMQHATDVKKVNEFISKKFRAIKTPTHWSRDHYPAQGRQWESRFGDYESHNHHVTLTGDFDHPPIVFEIQVTTCSDFMYNRLAHDWYYKKAHDPLSRKDEIVMDMLHGAAILFEIGGEYMKEREVESRGKTESEYDLVRASQLTKGIEEWKLEPETHTPFLKVL